MDNSKTAKAICLQNSFDEVVTWRSSAGGRELGPASLMFQVHLPRFLSISQWFG
jgi:hypothetical protein